jgi:hypothetical protein
MLPLRGSTKVFHGEFEARITGFLNKNALRVFSESGKVE